MAGIVQSIIFNKNRFTANEARKFLIDHNFHPIKPVDVTRHHFRFRLKNPDYLKRFAVKEITTGIKLVVEY